MLRKCKDCGLEAYTENDLEVFVKHDICKHGRENLCRDCSRKRSSSFKKENTGYTTKWNTKNRDKKNAHTAKRRATKLNATPAWADHEIINDFYLEARYHGMEVDHIIPLQHKMVCGLHVEHNLQLLTKEQNCSKGNSFED